MAKKEGTTFSKFRQTEGGAWVRRVVNSDYDWEKAKDYTINAAIDPRGYNWGKAKYNSGDKKLEGSSKAYITVTNSQGKSVQEELTVRKVEIAYSGKGVVTNEFGKKSGAYNKKLEHAFLLQKVRDYLYMSYFEDGVSEEGLEAKVAKQIPANTSINDLHVLLNSEELSKYQDEFLAKQELSPSSIKKIKERQQVELNRALDNTTEISRAVGLEMESMQEKSDKLTYESILATRIDNAGAAKELAELLARAAFIFDNDAVRENPATIVQQEGWSSFTSDEAYILNAIAVNKLNVSHLTGALGSAKMDLDMLNNIDPEGDEDKQPVRHIYEIEEGFDQAAYDQEQLDYYDTFSPKVGPTNLSDEERKRYAAIGAEKAKLKKKTTPQMKTLASIFGNFQKDARIISNADLVNEGPEVVHYDYSLRGGSVPEYQRIPSKRWSGVVEERESQGVDSWMDISGDIYKSQQYASLGLHEGSNIQEYFTAMAGMYIADDVSDEDYHKIRPKIANYLAGVMPSQFKNVAMQNANVISEYTEMVKAAEEAGQPYDKIVPGQYASYVSALPSISSMREKFGEQIKYGMDAEGKDPFYGGEVDTVSTLLGFGTKKYRYNQNGPNYSDEYADNLVQMGAMFRTAKEAAQIYGAGVGGFANGMRTWAKISPEGPSFHDIMLEGEIDDSDFKEFMYREDEKARIFGTYFRPEGSLTKERGRHGDEVASDSLEHMSHEEEQMKLYQDEIDGVMRSHQQDVLENYGVLHTPDAIQTSLPFETDRYDILRHYDKAEKYFEEHHHEMTAEEQQQFIVAMGSNTFMQTRELPFGEDILDLDIANREMLVMPTRIKEHILEEEEDEIANQLELDIGTDPTPRGASDGGYVEGSVSQLATPSQMADPDLSGVNSQVNALHSSTVANAGRNAVTGTTVDGAPITGRSAAGNVTSGGAPPVNMQASVNHGTGSTLVGKTSSFSPVGGFLSRLGFGNKAGGSALEQYFAANKQLKMGAEQGTQEWHDERAWQPTSSIIKSLIGKTGKDNPLSKVNDWVENRVSSIISNKFNPTNEHMQRGVDMEDPIADEYMRMKFGGTGITAMKMPLINSSTFPGGTSIDRLLVDKQGRPMREGLEIKAPDGEMRNFNQYSDQAQHQMHVGNLDQMTVVQGYYKDGKLQMHDHTFKRDPTWAIKNKAKIKAGMESLGQFEGKSKDEIASMVEANLAKGSKVPYIYTDQHAEAEKIRDQETMSGRGSGRGGDGGGGGRSASGVAGGSGGKKAKTTEVKMGAVIDAIVDTVKSGVNVAHTGTQNWIGNAVDMGQDPTVFGQNVVGGAMSGLTLGQSTNIQGQLLNMAGGMENGSFGAAKRLVIATRGALTFQEIQQYQNDPKALFQLMKSKLGGSKSDAAIAAMLVEGGIDPSAMRYMFEGTGKEAMGLANSANMVSADNIVGYFAGGGSANDVFKAAGEAGDAGSSIVEDIKTTLGFGKDLPNKFDIQKPGYNTSSGTSSYTSPSSWWNSNDGTLKKLDGTSETMYSPFTKGWFVKGAENAARGLQSFANDSMQGLGDWGTEAGKSLYDMGKVHRYQAPPQSAANFRGRDDGDHYGVSRESIMNGLIKIVLDTTGVMVMSNIGNSSGTASSNWNKKNDGVGHKR